MTITELKEKSKQAQREGNREEQQRLDKEISVLAREEKEAEHRERIAREGHVEWTKWGAVSTMQGPPKVGDTYCGWTILQVGAYEDGMWHIQVKL